MRASLAWHQAPALLCLEPKLASARRFYAKKSGKRPQAGPAEQAREEKVFLEDAEDYGETEVAPVSIYHLVGSPKAVDDYDFEAVHREMDKALRIGQAEFAQAFQWTSGHLTSSVLDSVAILDNATASGQAIRRPLSTLASVHAKDAQTLVVRAHDPLYMRAIEKALRSAASNSSALESCFTLHRESDAVLHVVLPKLDAAMRAQLDKHAAKCIESIKCKIRDIRRDALAHLDSIAIDDRQAIRKKVQSIHDTFIKKLDDFASVKRKEWQPK